MDKAVQLQQYCTEIRTALRHLKLALEATGASEPGSGARSQDVLELVAQAVALFVGILERLLLQVQRRELQVDMMLAALLREGCDYVLELIERLGCGAGRHVCQAWMASS